MRIWYLCYHSTKYPVVSFVHLDDDSGNHESVKITSFEEPIANSTLNPGLYGHVDPHSTSSLLSSGTHSIRNNVSVHTKWPADEHTFHDVGHISHIPRKPPTPTTYSIPSLNKSLVTEHNEEDLFGMIKLKDNDVCYTSGSIEWVGRKRSYPINSGFKIINESLRQGSEPLLKRVKRLDKTFTFNADKIKDCDCADVLPTVNAIVDHLNALHEAVDLVDFRLNTLEDDVGKH